MSGGNVARQALNNNPGYHLFTWYYHTGCTSEIVIPLNSIDLSSYDDTLRFLHGYEEGEIFVELCRDRGLSSGRLIDLCQLFEALIAVVGRLAHLLQAERLRSAIFFKAQIVRVWRRVPFIDMPEVTRFVERRGIPVMQEDECLAPFGTGPDSCLDLGELSAADFNSRYLNASIVLITVIQALGIPHHVLGFSENPDPETIQRLVQLGERAKTVGRQRSLSAMAR